MHMEVPPPIVEPAAPPPPAPVAPQGKAPVPTFVIETLAGLEELSRCIISHLEKIADRLNSIELRVKRLERTITPLLPHHPNVLLDLQTPSDKDEDDAK